jgi:hypothetical protein
MIFIATIKSEVGAWVASQLRNSGWMSEVKTLKVRRVEGQLLRHMNANKRSLCWCRLLA